MPIVDLSHTIRSGMAQYPGDQPPVRLVRKMTHAKDGLLSSALEVGCHVGTHIDAPYHFREDRPGLEEIPIEAFCGRAVVVDAPAGDVPGPIGPEILTGLSLGSVAFVIFRTGWERRWDTDQYYAQWPFLAPELATRLAAAKLKGLGLDTPSVDDHGERFAHDLFAAAGMVNLENLTNLDALPRHPFELMALPLKLAGTEASPVRAVALI